MKTFTLTLPAALETCVGILSDPEIRAQMELGIIQSVIDEAKGGE